MATALRDQNGHHLFHGPGAPYTQWGQTVDGTAAWQAALAKYGPDIYSTDDGRIVRNVGTESDPYYMDVGMLPHAQRPRGFGDFLLDNGPLLAGGAVIGAGAIGAAGAGAAASGAGASSAGAAGASAAGTAGASSFLGVPASTLFMGGTSLFGNLFGAWMQGKAANSAAQLEADAALKAAGLQDAASRRAEQFQREQAENAFQNNEAARRGNYDISAAQGRRLGFLGEEVGLGPREIPAYVPGVDPHYVGAGAPGTIGAVGNAAPGADYEGQFANLTKNLAPSPANLASLEPQLQALGISVHRNAAGQASKIILPNGQWIDPGIAFGTNDPAQMKWAWQVQGAGAPAASSTTSARPAYAAPAVPFLNSTPVAPTLGQLGAY